MTRIERLKQALPQDVDAAMIVSEENRRYFTGFRSSAGILLVTHDQDYFLADSRYIEAAKSAVPGCQVRLMADTRAALQEVCKEAGIRTVATEITYLTVKEFNRYAEALAPAELTQAPEVDQAILKLRRYKSADEVEKIRRAQKYTDEAFTHILNFIRAGRTEKEIALEMEFFMRKVGADNVSFDFIVVSGKNSSKPHGEPSGKVVVDGDFITMDFGAKVDGYCSDMTRTVAVGHVSEKQQLVYDTVLKAQLAALDAIAAGKGCKEIDSVARDIIYGAGFEGCFGHSLGHSVGIEIHEAPLFAPVSTDVVEPGIIMTVEPGIYLEGQFGVRIEDMIYVTENGVENLTHSPKKLILL